MSIRLTDKFARTVEAPVRPNRIDYDSEIKGFGLRTTKAGSKAFVLNYRLLGQERRFTIGQYPDWSVAAAREEAKKLKRLVDQGIDVMAQRHHDRSAPTVK